MRLRAKAGLVSLALCGIVALPLLGAMLSQLHVIPSLFAATDTPELIARPQAITPLELLPVPAGTETPKESSEQPAAPASAPNEPTAPAIPHQIVDYRSLWVLDEDIGEQELDAEEAVRLQSCKGQMDPEEFKILHKCPQWAPHRGFPSISEQDVVDLWQNCTSSFRVKITEGRFFAVMYQDQNTGLREREDVLTRNLVQSMLKVRLPDLDFVAFAWDDGYLFDQGKGVSPECHSPIMWVHDRFAASNPLEPLLPPREISWLKEQNLLLDDRVAWSAKLPKAVFRGATTGGGPRLNETTVYNCTRVRACIMSLERPELLDARITSIGTAQADTGAQIVMKTLGVMGDVMSLEQQLEHKMLLVLDGNSHPDRLLSMMMSGSAVLRQETPWEDMHDGYFRPWQHYVPVHRDLSDLMEKIEWGLSHDLELRLMVRRARRQALRLIQPQPEDTLICHLIDSLRNYAHHQTFTVTAPEAPSTHVCE